eukprot:scpid7534/ scgid35051/ 
MLAIADLRILRGRTGVLVCAVDVVACLSAQHCTVYQDIASLEQTVGHGLVLPKHSDPIVSSLAHFPLLGHSHRRVSVWNAVIHCVSFARAFRSSVDQCELKTPRTQVPASCAQLNSNYASSHANTPVMAVSAL